MFDASIPDARHGCSICRLHYIAHATPDGLVYVPACTCEHDAATGKDQQALVDRARGLLDECQRAMAPMLRA
jgi:hypothetical protein